MVGAAVGATVGVCVGADVGAEGRVVIGGVVWDGATDDTVAEGDELTAGVASLSHPATTTASAMTSQRIANPLIPCERLGVGSAPVERRLTPPQLSLSSRS